jgi:ribonuclease HI
MFRTAILFSRRPGPFATLASATIVEPQILYHIQTDGSFRYNDRISRTAVLLKKDTTPYSLVETYFDHANSQESEWCSVMNGLLYAQSHDIGAVKLENDNLGVITSLLSRKKPKILYAYYYEEILENARKMDWVDIRWIPRGLNKADALFRI